jgi:hypothetical protein
MMPSGGGTSSGDAAGDRILWQGQCRRGASRPALDVAPYLGGLNLDLDTRALMAFISSIGLETHVF